MLPVSRAVIPAAGLGSRMRAISKNTPKEMLIFGREPMIQHALEEIVTSGIRKICVVIREGKELIRNYFVAEKHLAEQEERKQLERLMGQCELTFLYQPKPLGLGDAILQARSFVNGQSFVMVIPDQLMLGKAPATSQLIAQNLPRQTIRSSLVRIPKAEVKFFPGAWGFDFEPMPGSELLLMRNLQTEEETSTRFRHSDHEIRGFGRTIFPPEIFDYLSSEFSNPLTGEVDLARTFRTATQELAHEGVLLEGHPIDLGTPESYYQYSQHFPEVQV